MLVAKLFNLEITSINLLSDKVIKLFLIEKEMNENIIKQNKGFFKLSAERMDFIKCIWSKFSLFSEFVKIIRQKIKHLQAAKVRIQSWTRWKQP